VYEQIVSTVRLFEAINAGLQDAVTPLGYICKRIMADHDDSVFSLKVHAFLQLFSNLLGCELDGRYP
jgi:hypothetical protein